MISLPRLLLPALGAIVIASWCEGAAGGGGGGGAAPAPAGEGPSSSCEEGAAAGVGSYVVHEDATIKVPSVVTDSLTLVIWELQLAPGQSSGLHTHSLPYTFYVLNSSTLEVTGADGEHFLTFTGQVGDALSFDLEGDYLVDPSRGRRIHKTHNAKNIGTTLFREVLVEKKVAVLAPAAGVATSSPPPN